VKFLISTITDTEEFTLEDRNDYIQSIKGARFFFKDKTIPDYAELLLRKAANVRKYTKQKDVDNKAKLIEWFVDEQVSVDDKFKKYLNIYEKY
jgi:hypothetical protein